MRSAGDYSSKLSFELNPPPYSTCRPISNFLRELEFIKGKSIKLTKLNAFINDLEVEYRKIEAFKQELPLSVVLLSDAISTLNDELNKYRDSSTSLPVHESENKKNWMNPTHYLFTTESPFSAQFNSGNLGESDRMAFENRIEHHHLPLLQAQNHSAPSISKAGKKPFYLNSGISGHVPGRHSLLIQGNAANHSVHNDEPDSSRATPYSVGRRGSAVGGTVQVQTDQISRLSNNLKNTVPPHPSAARKPRRTWTIDLRSRFVRAIEELGGSQVATPRQIRELMQVDGLTNDEVKSHLQKFRLHERKVSSSSTESKGKSTIESHDHDMGYSKSEIGKTSSPQGPFHTGVLSAICSSGGTTTFEDSAGHEEDDHNSAAVYSWRPNVPHEHQFI